MNNNGDASLPLSDEKDQIIDFDFVLTDEDVAYLNECDFVRQCIQQASEDGLESEVTHWALKEMKQNPSLSISDAIWIGLNEWVK